MRRIISLILLYFSGIVILGSFIRFSPDNKRLYGEFSFPLQKVDPPFVKFEEEKWVDSVFNSLSQEERIAQLFMIDVYPNRDENHFLEVESLIKKYNLGGAIFFRCYPEQLVNINNRLQKAAKTPMLMALDAEWGLGMRLNGTLSYPKQMALGAIQDDKLLYTMGVQIAQQLKRLGIQVNFAPVVDINNNPNNPVINIRSFGEDRARVTKKGLVYMAGLQDNNVLAVAKHFPGHGDTDADSHLALPIISHNRHRLDSIELFPFKEMINGGVGGIMIAHLNIPALDSTESLPSTLSSLIVDSLLQKEMGFKGLIFTDAMNMGGIAKYFKPVDANIKAIMAGNDVLLMPDEIQKTIMTILKEVRKGDIPEELIDAKCKKILAAKYWAGLNSYKPVEIKNLAKDLNKPEYWLENQKLIESSLSLLENHSNLIPLKRLDTFKIASVCIGGNKNNPFSETLGKYASIDNYYLPKEADSEILNKLYADLMHYNLIITGILETNINAGSNYGISNTTINFIDSIVQKNNVILDIFANPYSLSFFKNLKSAVGLLVSFEDDEQTQSLSAQLIFGAIPAKGLLPVTCKNYQMGDGILTENLHRFKYALPLEAGIKENSLKKIDSIALDAIAKRATPGCQILVARNGIVFYQKSFGYHTYKGTKEVINTDLYDLASVTKIAASMPAIMRLDDEDKLDINQKASYYLPNLDTTNKQDITLIDILFHQSRLKAWIPFYISTLEPLYPGQNFSSNKFSESYPIKIANHYYVNKHLKYIDGYYSKTYSDKYSVHVADHLYMNNSLLDTIWNDIANSELNGTEGYRYSDLGFYWLYRIIENITHRKFENYLDSTFYNTLGAWSMCFNPLNRFDKNQIVPTENDLIFRKQIVHGYVHDMGAAMLGGVSGHAGLFSNANDLAKIMQMLLNGGEYGDIRYLDSGTVDYYTKGQDSRNQNRRGVGFDKPEPDPTKNGPSSKLASSESYGHTGFTGTMAWVDPNCNLVYIFLSNRVYPDISNNKLLEMDVRTKIQDVIYTSIMDD